MFSKSILITIIFLLFSIQVNAQNPGFQLNQGRQKLTLDLSTNYEYGFDTNLDGGGNFNINRFSIKGGLKKPIDKKWNISLSTVYSLTNYDFNGNEGLAGLNPWNKINRVAIGFRINHRLNRKWTLNAGPLLRFSGESGSNFGDSLTYGGNIGFIYVPGPNVLIGLGLIINSRLEDDLLVVPGFVFNWKINNKFTLSSLLTGIRTELGPNIKLLYSISSNLRTGINIGYEFERFRLDDKGIANGGIGDIKVLPVWLNLNYDFNPILSFAIYSGIGFLGEMELENSDGERIQKEDFDSLIFVGAGLKVNL